jgi:hypothetical protein
MHLNYSKTTLPALKTRRASFVTFEAGGFNHRLSRVGMLLSSILVAAAFAYASRSPVLLIFCKKF